MKRFLSWLVLLGCYLAFAFLVSIYIPLINFVFDLYGSLNAFLKLLILIIGGSFLLGIVIAPVYYGIPLMHTASEAVCESRKGVRYTVFGIWVLTSTVLEAITGVMFRDIFFAILGISFIVIGRNTRKRSKEYGE